MTVTVIFNSKSVSVCQSVPPANCRPDFRHHDRIQTSGCTAKCRTSPATSTERILCSLHAVHRYFDMLTAGA